IRGPRAAGAARGPRAPRLGRRVAGLRGSPVAAARAEVEPDRALLVEDQRRGERAARPGPEAAEDLAAPLPEDHTGQVRADRATGEPVRHREAAPAGARVVARARHDVGAAARTRPDAAAAGPRPAGGRGRARGADRI